MSAVQRNDALASLALAGACCAPLALYLSWLLGFAALAPAMAVATIAAMVFCLAVEAKTGRWIVALFLISLALISLGSPSGDWDARSIWLFHAGRIFVDQNLSAQLDGYASWSHNDYPVLVPAVSASLASLVGFWNELFPKLAGIIVLGPALVILMKRLSSTAAQLAFLALVLFCAGRLLVNGYMDGLLAMYFVASFMLAMDLFEVVPAEEPASATRSWVASATTVAVLSGLTLLKNEGLVAVAVVVACVGLLALLRNRRIPRRALVLVGLSLLLILQWKVLIASHGVVNDLSGSDLGSQLLMRLPDPQNSLSISKSLFLGKFLLPAALFVFAAWRFRMNPLPQVALMTAAAYAAVLFAVYMSTPSDLAWHLTSSADRTVLPVGLLLGYAAICCPWHAIGTTVLRRKPDA